MTEKRDDKRDDYVQRDDVELSFSKLADSCPFCGSDAISKSIKSNLAKRFVHAPNCRTHFPFPSDEKLVHPDELDDAEKAESILKNECPTCGVKWGRKHQDGCLTRLREIIKGMS